MFATRDSDPCPRSAAQTLWPPDGFRRSFPVWSHSVAERWYRAHHGMGANPNAPARVAAFLAWHRLFRWVLSDHGDDLFWRPRAPYCGGSGWAGLTRHLLGWYGGPRLLRVILQPVSDPSPFRKNGRRPAPGRTPSVSYFSGIPGRPYRPPSYRRSSCPNPSSPSPSCCPSRR